jgi:uncharacterized protein
MPIIMTFLASLLFGLGLVISGLVNPAKVLNFLDVAGIWSGTWDPSLIFTMAAAVVITSIGYRLVMARQKPLCADQFHIPAASTIDAKLVTGAGLFGIGWGLVGYCPGPAITALSLAHSETFIFVAAMLAGMALGRRVR